jgi:2-phosphosulfolactate phosphatase
VAAFAGARGELARILWDCASGRELRGMGYPGDVSHSAKLDLYDAVPVMRGERLERA